MKNLDHLLTKTYHVCECLANIIVLVRSEKDICGLRKHEHSAEKSGML